MALGCIARNIGIPEKQTRWQEESAGFRSAHRGPASRAAIWRALPQRKARLRAWSVTLAAWMVAAVTAIALVRLEGAPPC